jgi:hypothetical protein
MSAHQELDGFQGRLRERVEAVEQVAVVRVQPRFFRWPDGFLEALGMADAAVLS